MNWTQEQWDAKMAELKQPPAGAGLPIPTVRESVIEGECTRILECDGWRALRTDPVRDRGRGKGFGEIGMADHLYIRYDNPFRGGGTKAFAEVLWVEFKRPGEKPKKHQTAWHIRERARGAFTVIAGENFPATVEGFRNWYTNSGLMRRRS